MGKQKELLIVFLSAVIITLLFHRQSPGLNVIIYESALFIWLLLSKQFQFSGKTRISAGLALLVTGVFTVITHSVFSYIMHFISLFILTGILIYPEARSLVTSIRLSLGNIFSSQLQFLRALASSSVRGRNLYSYLRRSRIFIIPAAIIILFITLYKNANPVFDGFLSGLHSFIQKYIVSFINDMDFLFLLTFLLALPISIFLLFRTYNKRIVQQDTDAKEDLERRKKNKTEGFAANGLKNEFRAGVFLLTVLNGILLIVNLIDIYWVWFHFEWQGQYLKQFVHEGTYLLILSLLISIILVLYLFRGNLNFYGRNRWLKILSAVWLAQNMVLAVSVAIRNYRYIEYFALAYKRIGVFIFLLLTIYGLYTVWIKVRERRSAFYLLRTNAMAAFLVLAFSSLFDWDSIIAKYNFGHAGRSFVHLSYLSTLSDKSLPYLDKPIAELQKIDSTQRLKYPSDDATMSPWIYAEIMERRKTAFILNWESKSILSWNLPEYRAYQKLKAERTQPVLNKQ